ncbi:CHASE2 domain-containing protein [Paraburkholderia sp. BL27I4N3]|uniref:CHASE2 domain-containing protein n=1 Tax=Paraburkholderia sp. BL27I4N3 TaxID=1938805 RepID=UPI000E22D59C|nr:CHASE2 domain-containing protein [Paraburkholderia sp. BL27I4N3]REE22712.1 CHASE2 domain-containing protein [Paraburkholderia sp. BL27I4N3]
MAKQKEEQGHKDAKHEGGGFWHLFGRAALSVVLGIVLAFLLPTRFGEEMGAQTMARYAAPFSGYLFDRARAKVVDNNRVDWYSKSITVLVIDAEVLRACKEGWPAHYSFYSWLLQYLNRFPPKGVFIDVILSQSKGQDAAKRKKAKELKDPEEPECRDETVDTGPIGTLDESDFDHFKNALMRLTSQNNVPVFLAARRTIENTLVTNPDLDSDDDLKKLKRVGIEFSAHSVDRLAWTYPLVYPKDERPGKKKPSPEQTAHSVPEQPGTSEGDCPRSAAFSIFKELYHGTLDVPCTEAAFMSVTWPLDTAAYGLHWHESMDGEREERHGIWPRVDSRDGDEDMYCTSNESQIKLLWRAEARAFLRPLSRPLCVHYRTIHASQLPKHMGDGPNVATPNDLELSDAELNDAFRGRFVMIGTSFAYSNDLVLSPLQDRIPGVFLHAAALDNLLSYPNDLEKVEAWELKLKMPLSRWGKILTLGIVGFIGFFIIVSIKKKVRKVFAEFHHERTHWRKRFHPHWWIAKSITAGFNIALFVISLAVLVSFGVAMILFGAWMDIPFLVVAHILACAIAVESLEWSEHLFNWITDSKEK